MENKIFRLANENDFNTILNLYKSVLNSPYCSWDDEYPCMDNIVEDFESECLFVYEFNNVIIGVISINPENELDELSGWTNKEAMEFARVAIDPKYQNQGYGKTLVSLIINKIINDYHNDIHILASKSNLPANLLYKSLGFIKVGEVFMYGNDYCMLELKNENKSN